MDRSNPSRIASNALSILTSDAANKATAFILYAMVARYLGALAFGQMSLALTLFYVFQVFAVAGLNSLVIREVARDRTRTDQYLVNASAVAAAFSLLSTAIMILFVRLMNYAPDTASIIVLVSLGLLPYSLSAICEAVFLALERMQYIAFVRISVNIARICLAFLILSRGYSLHHLMILLLASYVAAVCVQWWLLLQRVTKPPLRFDPNFLLAMIRSTGTFLGIDGLMAIRSALVIVLLSKLGSEVEIGLYGAAIQLMAPVLFVYRAVLVSVFPMMCRSFESNFKIWKRRSENLIELLLVIAVPACVALFFLADSALLLIYGEGFLVASRVLRIMVWVLIMRALIHPFDQMLIISLREKVVFRIIVINVFVTLILALILVSQFGLIGGAIATLLTSIVAFFQRYVSVSRHLFRVALGQLAWKPVAAGVIMALYLVVMRDQRILLAGASAAALYVGIMIAIALWSARSLYGIKARYLLLWSD